MRGRSGGGVCGWMEGGAGGEARRGRTWGHFRGRGAVVGGGCCGGEVVRVDGMLVGVVILRWANWVYEDTGVLEL